MRAVKATAAGLQEALREQVRKRIARGEFTQGQLSRDMGLAQAHISNFLLGKRGLKARTLDRMLGLLGLSVYDLLDPRDIAAYLQARKRGGK